jgi:hypothetical protein
MGKLAGGIALSFVALFMLIGFLAGGGADQSALVRLMAFGVAVGIPGAAGGALLWQHARRTRLTGPAGPDQLRGQTHQSEVVKLAQHKGGRLTIVEIVADTALSIDQAEAALAALVERGMAEVEVTDRGLIVYVFRDLQQLPDKARSRGVLDA